MPSITSYQEISLHDYLNKNIQIIMLAIYTVVFLSFNQYSINNLYNMINEYPSNEIKLRYFISDLRSCQQYHLLYLFILKYSKDIVGISPLAIENLRLGSLLFFEFLKTYLFSYFIYWGYSNQLDNMFDPSLKDIDRKISNKYLNSFEFLVFTYSVKSFTIWMITLSFVLICLFVMCEGLFQNICDYFKSIRVREEVDIELEEQRNLISS